MKKKVKLTYSFLMCLLGTNCLADSLPDFDGAYVQTNNDKFIELKVLSGKNEPSGSKCFIDSSEYPATINLIDIKKFKQFIVIGEKFTDSKDLHRLDNGGHLEQGYEWFCRLKSPYVNSKTRNKDDVFYLKPTNPEPGIFRLWRGNSGYSYIIRFK